MISHTNSARDMVLLGQQPKAVQLKHFAFAIVCAVSLAPHVARATLLNPVTSADFPLQFSGTVQVDGLANNMIQFAATHWLVEVEQAQGTLLDNLIIKASHKTNPHEGETTPEHHQLFMLIKDIVPGQALEVKASDSEPHPGGHFDNGTAILKDAGTTSTLQVTIYHQPEAVPEPTSFSLTLLCFTPVAWRLRR